MMKAVKVILSEEAAKQYEELNNYSPDVQFELRLQNKNVYIEP